jgi:hypothetical protein
MRLKTLILVGISAFFLWPKAVMAVDLSVTCTGGDCSVSPSTGAALFSEGNLAPGQTIIRRISVQNSNVNDDCSLSLTTKNLQDAGGLAGVLATVINDGPTVLFTDNFTQLFPTKTINLGTVPKSGSKVYDWIVTFSAAADNYFQSLEAKFDFDLAFTCGVPPPVPPGAPSPTSPSTPPTCTAVAPGAPTGLGATLGGTGQVNLSWTAPGSPYTYFLVAYSDSPAWPPKWGNPSVGNVTSYTVSGLGSGTYWFWVRAGNGCQPGPYAGPTSSVAVVGTPGTAGPAAGFVPGVLGQQENLNTGIATQAAGQVKSASTFAWWLYLLLAGGTIFLLMIFFFLRRRYNDR